jgi:hypothetical protein
MRNLASALGLVAALFVAAGLSAFGQSAPARPQQSSENGVGQAAQNPQQPMFRSAVDLVPVDVNIIDRNGRPVSGLEAGDFALTIDGRPRRIASAQSSQRRVMWKHPQHPRLPITARIRRRLVADSDACRGSGQHRGRTGKLAIDAAGRFISRLSPSDRIGLVAIPGSGPQLDFTSNHALVKTMLPSLVGQAHAFQSPYRIGISEAVAIQRGDRTALAQLLDRSAPASASRPKSNSAPDS